MADIDRWNDPNDLGDFGRFLDCKKRSAVIVEQARKYATTTCNILDLGCGSGRDMLALRAAGFAPVFGIDVIRQARGWLADCYLIQGRLQDVLPRYADKQFALSYSWTVLQHIPPVDIATVIYQIARVSKTVITIENERGPARDYLWLHDYPMLFEAAGMKQIDSAEIDTRGEPFGGIYNMRIWQEVKK